MGREFADSLGWTALGLAVLATVAYLFTLVERYETDYTAKVLAAQQECIKQGGAFVKVSSGHSCVWSRKEAQQ